MSFTFLNIDTFLNLELLYMLRTLNMQAKC